MPKADPPDTPLHVSAEEWFRRRASRDEIAARRQARLLRQQASAPTVDAERVFLPSTRWPPPSEKAYLTACEALTWIGWGDARPKERASEFEAKLLEVWGVSSACVGDLIHAFETGQPQERLIATPEQVRDHIQKREGREYTLAELAERLRKDRAVLAQGCELLELASEALIKACVDGELQAVGRRGTEPASTIPNDVFFQVGVTVTWWDTIDADRVSWEFVRFRASDVLRLWPPDAPDPDQSPPAAVMQLPSFARLARIGRLSERLAQSPEWVNGDKLADWWTRQGGAVTGEKRRQLFDEACRSIFRGVLAGEFMGYGPHPHLVKHGSLERVLPAGPNVVTGTWFSGDGEIDALREHVKVLWLPAIAVKAWLATHNMKLPSWLTDSPPEPAPSGFLYIDSAVVVVQQCLGWSEGRASATLVDAFVGGEIATRRRNPARHPAGPHGHFDRENWRGARLDVEAFRRLKHGGAVVLGREYHLHRFLVHAADFETWLRRQSSCSEMQDVVQIASGKQSVARMDQRVATERLSDILSVWFTKWAAHHPQHSEPETMKAAKDKFSGETITRQMIRDLRKLPDGKPRQRGQKPGKSLAEHGRRMRRNSPIR